MFAAFGEACGGAYGGAVGAYPAVQAYPGVAGGFGGAYGGFGAGMGGFGGAQREWLGFEGGRGK